MKSLALSAIALAVGLAAVCVFGNRGLSLGSLAQAGQGGEEVDESLDDAYEDHSEDLSQKVGPPRTPGMPRNGALTQQTQGPGLEVGGGQGGHAPNPAKIRYKKGDLPPELVPETFTPWNPQFAARLPSIYDPQQKLMFDGGNNPVQP
eukprot:gnl/MRDRNA2_/MRDRNA2_61975_c0_seq3.p1 gnl/MRDRNA2_/MRDRNA2_61975_c0~~gnl/MRDRNA2_/MRDRNA2_61975_c0_seq3.p1  ORF type:complete len:148 (-),score=27.02 gnl/MRDRNA2_/MRDRNA2_61975_c0_seq3:391-834(-)